MSGQAPVLELEMYLIRHGESRGNVGLTGEAAPFDPLFYALPIEIVSKQKEYLDFPRCPYDPIWTIQGGYLVKRSLVD